MKSNEEFRKECAERYSATLFYESNVRSKRWKTLEQNEDQILIGFDDEDDYIISFGDAIIKPTALRIVDDGNGIIGHLIFLSGEIIDIPINNTFICITQVDSIEDELEMYELSVREIPAHVKNFDIQYPVFEIETTNGYDLNSDTQIQLFKLYVYLSPLDLLPIPYGLYKTMAGLNREMDYITRRYKEMPILYKNGGGIVYIEDEKKFHIELEESQIPGEIYKVRDMNSCNAGLSISFRTILSLPEKYVYIDSTLDRTKIIIPRV